MLSEPDYCYNPGGGGGVLPSHPYSSSPVYKTVPSPQNNSPVVKPARPQPIMVDEPQPAPPAQAVTTGSNSQPAPASTQPYIPSRSSQANLEAMLGLSLTSALNSVDQQQQQQQQLQKQQQQQQAKSRTGHQMSTVVEVQQLVRAQSLDNELRPCYAQYYSAPGRLMERRQVAGASTTPVPIMPSPVHVQQPPHHHYHQHQHQHQQQLHVNDQMAQSYPPTSSSSSYMVPQEERYTPSPPSSERINAERMMMAAAKKAAAMSPSSTSTSSGGGGNQGQRSLFQTAAGVELVQFLLETESRAMILFNVESLPVDVLRMACENLGTLVYIRVENKAAKGVVFLAYHDLRASMRAFHTLPKELSLLTERPVVAHYSIMLNAANSPRDGILLVKDVQASVSESDVHAVFSAYGQLKNVHRRICNNQYSNNNGTNTEFFLVEYYDVQDAKLAAYELSSSTPWGRNIVVEEAERPEKERALGQQLLLTLKRWSREEPSTCGSSYSSMSTRSADDGLTSCSPCSSPNITPPQIMYIKPSFAASAGSPPLMAYPATAAHHHHSSYEYGITAAGAAQPAAAYYTMDPTAPFTEDGLCNGLQNVWVTSSSSSQAGMPTSPSGKRSPTGAYFPRRGMKREVCLGLGSMGEAEFQLDVDKVQRGLDKRTTIMIRNIPNKYSQQLLLAEINENNKGKYDFFYLPIDFKNKCNVGYAFINFIDYRAIAAFFREFNGQRWKNYNSEKVCSLTYARIQGKQSMITRFQNSSLMEKDWEYRPLLFHSAGMERGKPEPFPVGPKQTRRLSSSSQASSMQVSLGPATGMLPPGFSPVAVWSAPPSQHASY